MGRDLTLRLTADRPGELARVAQTLSSAGVNIEGIAEIEGVVHILARDPSAARSALRAGGYIMDGELEVLVVPMTDRPGELSMIMQRLADASVNLRFIYLATDTRVVIGVDDITRARAALESSKN
ncbi:MAG TPA: amino acid-binding protein [Candidatus Dormibacteraeota bacterium]|nr:amino acid-binding protein [Candidatus Dormibacteraeota bacterium]